MSQETRELADALRAAVDAAVGMQRPDASAVEAAALIREATALLSGPVRPHFAKTFTASSGQEPEDAYREYSAISGFSHPIGVPLELSWGLTADGAHVATAAFRFGAAHEGAPRCAHGGWIAAVFDELLGLAQMKPRIMAATGELTVRFRRPTPIDRDLVMRAWFDPPAGRRMKGYATCHVGDRLTAEAETLFVIVEHGALERGLD